MVVGKCALCEKTRELCDSHLLPAGFYRITREGETPNKGDYIVVYPKPLD